jgi:imidazole glycerol phosphate synthase glutamine amidotransferase subunit
MPLPVTKRSTLQKFPNQKIFYAKTKMKKIISIIDYGNGNIESLVSSIRRLGVSCHVAANYQDVMRSHALLLPGVGGFGAASCRLSQLGLSDALLELNLKYKPPILGICLGMQLLGETSEEGAGVGLGLIRGHTLRLQGLSNSSVRVPHLGWNSVFVQDDLHSLWEGISSHAEFYFCHSYFLDPDDKQTILAKTGYGIEFASVVVHENIVCVQFHPEKSGFAGRKLLENFMSIANV